MHDVVKCITFRRNFNKIQVSIHNIQPVISYNSSYNEEFKLTVRQYKQAKGYFYFTAKMSKLCKEKKNISHMSLNHWMLI